MNRKRKITTTQSETHRNGTISKNKRSKTTDIKKSPGTIERMVLKNFMCHSLLEVQFCDNISIIIGRNGSGKSAILTALIIGLGGKANLTNRGNSVKNFIKKERKQASIEIELYNGNNCMSYHPETYGERIIIVRQLLMNGSSSYKIKNIKGDIISKSTKELKNMLTVFNIQIDNPICILNQDTSRNFLNSNDPKQKFALFLKATQLDILFDEYERSNCNRNETKRILNEKEKDFNKSQLELNNLKRKIDNYRNIIDYKKRIKSFNAELFWAKLRDSELELKNKQNEFDELNRKYQRFINKSTDRNERIRTVQQNITDLERQIKELQDNASTQLRPCTNVQRLLTELKDNLNKKLKEKQMIQNTIETKTRNINILKEQIVNNNENVERVEREKTERLQNLTKLEEKSKSLEEHLQTYRNELYQISNDVQRLNDEKQNIHQVFVQIDQKIHNEQSSLNALQNESTNNLLLYGRDMPRIKQLIETQKEQFKQLPRGPVGYYIRLKDKKWATAVESFIGRNLLTAFIVDNINDNRLLRSIFEKNYTNGEYPSIITNKFIFKTHDVSKNLVASPNDCISVYEALDIQDPIVSNCLIDQLQIERILLIPNDKRAIELMSIGRNVPRNCLQSLTINGDRYYPDPNYRTYSARFNNRVRYLQTNKKDIINDIKRNIELYNNDKKNYTEQINELMKRINEQQNKKRQLEEKTKKFNVNKLELRRQLDQLKSIPEPEVPNIRNLESELNELQTLISQKTVQLQNMNDELKKLKKSIQENEEKLQELKNKNRDLEERINKFNEEIKNQTLRATELETENKFEKRQIDDLKQQLHNKETNEIKRLQEEVKMNIEKVADLGERIETTRQVQEILDEKKKIERYVHSIEMGSDNIDNVEKKHNQLYKKIEKASDLLKNSKNSFIELNDLVEKNNKHCNITREYFTTRIRHTFKRFMEIREFVGTIDINVKENLLEIVVVPKQQQNSQKTVTTTNLSGGERSFSTVAFLYSLWQCMEFPFYFLDEFDVYMDKLNRTQVVNILLEHAKTHSWLQYVLLTPQDVSFVDRSINILRLEDPSASS